jgi:hypothetical protein
MISEFDEKHGNICNMYLDVLSGNLTESIAIMATEFVSSVALCLHQKQVFS